MTAAQAKAEPRPRPRRLLPARWPAAWCSRRRRGRRRPRREAAARPGSPRRSSSCGCSRRWSHGGSACRPRESGRPQLRPPRRSALRLDRAGAPGGSSRPSSAPRTTRCRPTTSRTTRGRSSPTARRPRTSGCTCCPPSTARDFGWIGTLEMVERLEATLATIGELERFHGHLYNWYDTRDLSRLEPALRLDGRQRQPRRPSAGAVQRLSPDDRSAAAGRARRSPASATPSR